LQRYSPRQNEALCKRANGDTNILTLQGPGGRRDVTIVVRPWEWRDVLFAEGGILALGAIFVLVGVGSFLLRPFDPGSWAMLAMSCAAGGVFCGQLLHIGPHDAVK